MNDKEIRQAFEKMTPNKNARSRMLDHILKEVDKQRTHIDSDYLEPSSQKSEIESALRKEDTSADDKRTNVSRETFSGNPELEHSVKLSHTNVPRKKPSTWAVALPLAAALTLLVGVGLFATNILPFSSPAEEGRAFQSKDMAESTAGSSLAENAENIPSDTPPAPKNLSQNYPLIESDQLGHLYIIDEGKADASIANPSHIGPEIGAAKATSSDGQTTVTCTLYEYLEDDSSYYAVLYEGDTNYYLASLLAR